MPTPNVRTEWIGRGKALEYMERNRPFEYDSGRTNRPLSTKIALNYAEQMLRGEWNLTHQGIAFDINDNMFDGQHRMQAIIFATDPDGTVNGLPTNPNLRIQMQVTRNADPDNFELVDTGRTRSSAQVLAMLGIRGSGPVAAAGRLVHLFDNVSDYQLWRRQSVSRHEIRVLVEGSDILSWQPHAEQLKHIGLITSAALAGIFVCHRAQPDADMETFVRLLKDGNPEELTSEHPIFVLREASKRSRSGAGGPRRDSDVHFFMVIKTWNDWLNDRTRHYITWRSNEGIIRPVGWEG